MTDSAAALKARLLRHAGLSESAINAAWPEWWSADADASPSAQAELRFSIARKLGLDARSLIDDDAPRFVWDDSARFKGFDDDHASDRPAIASFGMSVGRLLLQGSGDGIDPNGRTADELRESLLRRAPVVGVPELLALCWGMGIPVVHLRIYPLDAKRMTAMSVRVGDRYAILLAKDASYPAPIAFHIAHELGHICLGHLNGDTSIIDLHDFAEGEAAADQEELDADAFGLALLTGSPSLRVLAEGPGRGARQLASEVTRVGIELGIEPGTLALAYGHSTGQWGTATKALSYIYSGRIPAWMVVNRVATRQLDWAAISDDAITFLTSVLGTVE